MDNRIKELDGLRGVAVIVVMALHIFKRASYFTTHPILLAITKLTSVGWVGVDIFFALSGFLITSILLRAKQEEHYFRNFYVRRVLRIFPLYYAALAVLLLFAPKIEPEFTKQLNIALPVLLLYQQNWAILFKDFHLTQYLGITWSLAIEEQFYLIWPLVVFFLNRQRLLKASIGYIVLSLTVRILCTLFWGNLGDVSRFFYYASFARFEEMLFGALLAVFLTGEGSREPVRRYSLPVFIGSFLGFAALCLMSLPGSMHPEYTNYPLTIGGYTTAALFTTGLVGVFITHPVQDVLRRFFQNPILTFFGKYSYSMYLFHVAAALVLLDIFWHGELRGWKPYFLYIITTYSVTVLISLLTWNLLEKHMLGLKKYFEYKNPPLR
jgi:peptidoglycan/LPS O-acetylase OafA/YrhL